MAENENKTPETVEAVSAVKTKAVKKKKKPSRIAAWFRTTKAEMGKIAWTPRKTVAKNSALVLVVMIALALIIGALDLIFGQTIAALSNLVG